MIKKTNNKGMTLVEIVVVLLIASIIMTITGGILVNSLGYFDTTTKKSLDKHQMVFQILLVMKSPMQQM